jgi:GNAT superfamily N-acetyltransferase
VRASPDESVRVASRRDLDRVAELWIELTRHHAGFEPMFALRAGADAEIRRLLDAQLRDPDTAIFVAERDGGGLRGFCTVRVDRAPPIHAELERAEITDIAVVASARRRGVGRRLVGAALDWLRLRGIERVEVRVAVRNREGQDFWRALGFADLMDVLHRHL